MSIYGSNNIESLVNVYNILDTGIQISGSYTESKDNQIVIIEMKMVQYL
ncbi:hypothetical protein KTC96_20910 [Clostridium estertheticum]|nr:hypothetical protein [Clostridium estertheticum]MBX4262957.1 hypothetical protein [Clostridium estertheticum]WLC70267.1 hypothetical protein KTC96_20910 [Clostridium estertheticum]